MTNRLRLRLGDITAMRVDAVVNSTDNTLQAGGPVHVAVHRAAGPELAKECLEVGDCPVGEVAIGMDVTVCFEELPGFGLIPNWTV